jgi:L-threonylcarbamoyladenylate synthase
MAAMNVDAKSAIRLADRSVIEDAARMLRAGRLVAFPTETVYGLGADATNDRAVAEIFAAKRRPRFNPLIVHVPSLQNAEAYSQFNAAAHKLAIAFWPGAVTLVLPRRANCSLSQLVSAGLETVAVRVPAHPVARQLLEASGVPIAAPSANASGRISATTAQHVEASLGSSLDLIIDGGTTPLGLESSVIGFEEGHSVLLRSGAVTRADIERVVGQLGTYSGHAIRSPGRMASHYAPHAPLRLNATAVGPNEVLLAFGPKVPDGAARTLNLSARADLKEAAANFFAMLHLLDASGLPIAVMPIPQEGLGVAINDRLMRAAAPREPQ